jgi:GT2 family glycosyltransferase
MMVEISVLVVNWNGERMLADALGSLGRQSYANREIILIDNGSTDSSVRFVRERFPEVKVVPLHENNGFAGGNLAGFRTAEGQFIAFVNNDAKVSEFWLENLSQPMFEDSTVGICEKGVRSAFNF